MAYNKKTWANGDLITKESMNNIENGIYKAHDEIETLKNNTSSGTGITPEQATQLTTAYQHSQTAHVQTSDIPTKTSQLNNDSNFVNETYVTNAINNAQLGGGETEVDLSIYQTKTDNTLNTTDKTVVGAINEINETMVIAEEQTGDITVGDIPVGGSNDAKDISITDTGNYFTSTNVEGALQEVGSQIKEIANKVDDFQIYEAYDLFSKENGRVGISDCGQSYMQKGNVDTYFTVENNEAKINKVGNAYMSLSTKNNIKTVGASWYWTEGTTDATWAIVITNDEMLTLNNLCHFITNTKGWNLQIRISDLGIDLNPAVLSGVYENELKRDGTIYTFEMSVDRNTKFVYLKLPDGNVASYYAGDYIDNICGKRAYWQVIKKADTDKDIRIKSVWLSGEKDIYIGSEKDNFMYQYGVKLQQQLEKDYNKIVKMSFTPTQAGWVRLFETTTNIEFNGKIKLYTKESYDNTITNLGFDFLSMPYSRKNKLSIIDTYNANRGIIEAIRIGNDGSQLHYLDVKIKSATSPRKIFIECSGYFFLNIIKPAENLNLTYEPTTYKNNTEITLNNNGMIYTDPIMCYAVNAFYEVLSGSSVPCSELYGLSIIDSTDNNVTVTLPKVADNVGHVHTIAKLSKNSNTVTVLGSFNDGTTSKTVDVASSLKIVSNGEKWIIL